MFEMVLMSFFYILRFNKFILFLDLPFYITYKFQIFIILFIFLGFFIMDSFQFFKVYLLLYIFLELYVLYDTFILEPLIKKYQITNIVAILHFIALEKILVSIKIFMKRINFIMIFALKRKYVSFIFN